jgi:hypothetical protein
MKDPHNFNSGPVEAGLVLSIRLPHSVAEKMCDLLQPTHLLASHPNP